MAKKKLKYDFIFHFWREGEVVVINGKIKRKKNRNDILLVLSPFFSILFLLVLGGTMCEDFLHTFTIKICTHKKPGWKWNYYVVVV